MSKEPEIVQTIDGIAEYDNPLPGWWLTMTYGSILFSIVYWVLYPSWFGPGLLKWSQYKQYDQETKVAVERAAAGAAKVGGSLLAIVKDPAAIAAGKVIFTQNCAACHGAGGEGGIGPSLIKPPYWAYGKGTPEDLEYIVTNGTKVGMTPAAKGGMPAWGPILGKTKIQQAVAFVYSLENPPGK